MSIFARRAQNFNVPEEMQLQFFGKNGIIKLFPKNCNCTFLGKGIMA